MGQFRNAETGVVVSVDDAKDERFASGWESVSSPAPAPAKKTAAKRPASAKSDK